jgi:hypothetical protein
MDKGAIISRFKSQDGQVWSWILRIFLVAAVVGIIISQCGPIIWNHLSISSVADDAADLAVLKYENSRDVEKVTKEVEDWLVERGVRLDGNITLITDQTGKITAIGVPVRKIVNTVLFENVGYLCSYTEASAYSERSLFK